MFMNVYDKAGHFDIPLNHQYAHPK
jgi:hypothetical protein